MRNPFSYLFSLAVVVLLAGCQSDQNNIAVSPSSDLGQQIRKMDEAERQYEKNVRMYEQSMTAFEKSENRGCGKMRFSRLSSPLQILDAHSKTGDLQGSSSVCGYQNYKIRITYSDDAYGVVSSVAILQRLTQ